MTKSMRFLAAFLTPLALLAQFDYDRTQPFDKEREKLAARKTATLWGASFEGPKGGKVNYVLVEPVGAVKPPFAGVIFQHGGQSMTNYVSEALILAELGVVSIIPDAPARGPGKNNDSSKMNPREAQDHAAKIVIEERRTLDLLLQQPGVDPKRIAYVGHSYGGIAGGKLAGVEPRISTFILMGAVASETDPERFLPSATRPILVQCAKFDTDENVRGCPVVHQLAGGPKRLTWYDDDHNF